jgi:hypothetical protein
MTRLASEVSKYTLPFFAAGDEITHDQFPEYAQPRIECVQVRVTAAEVHHPVGNRRRLVASG